jgi:hypothetical protein
MTVECDVGDAAIRVTEDLSENEHPGEDKPRDQ